MILVAATAMVIGYFAAKGLTGDDDPLSQLGTGPAAAAPSDLLVATAVATPTDDEIERFEDDAAAPRFVGSLAGVKLVESDRDGSYYPCSTGNSAPTSEAKGTALALLPDPLPHWLRRDSFNQGGTTVCEGLLVASGEYLLAYDNHLILVQRQRVPEAWATAGAPAQRVKEGFLAGHRVVLVEPFFPDGRPTSLVIFAEPADVGWVVTTVEGIAAPFDVVLQVAEELLR